MEIRLLNRKDAIAFRTLRLKGLETDAYAFGSTYEQESQLSLDKFKKRLTPSDSNFVVGCFDEDTLVCTATFTRASGVKDHHKGFIFGMYCEKDYRGTGTARRMIHHLIREVRNIEGVEIINLSVVNENLRARVFYESFGFKIYGTEPKALFDGSRYYDEDLMYLEL